MSDTPERDEKLDARLEGLLDASRAAFHDIEVWLEVERRRDPVRRARLREKALASRAAIHAYFAEREREVEKRVTVIFGEQWTSFGSALREKDTALALQELEIRRLHAERNEALDQATRLHAELRTARIDAANERLREALRKYGKHGYSCDLQFSPDGVCDCGFDAALASPQRSAPPDAGCVTTPDGSCVSEGPCMHSPKEGA